MTTRTGAHRRGLAPNPWRLVPPPVPRPVRTWAAFLLLVCVALLAALGQFLVVR